MGLLDDAIREHLDLKRRRGADPEEVERAEREALGPVRRVGANDAATVDEAEDHEVLAGEELDEFDELDDRPAPGGVAFDHEADEESWSFKDDLGGPETEAGDGADLAGGVPDPLGQETAVHRPDFLDDDAFDEPDFEPRRGEGPPAGGSETMQYDVEEEFGHHPAPHPAEGEGEEGEELLEETPEFLQDTPDHDRLWFEQRPPKDFDFDG